MLSSYPACFFKEANGYSVIFPDLNIATCGDSLDHALEMSIDCLAGYIYSANLAGEKLPAASSLSSVSLSDIASDIYDSPDDFSEAFVNLVSVNVDEYAHLHFAKAVKKTLTIPKWMNDKAISLGINFSQVLQEALLQRFS